MLNNAGRPKVDIGGGVPSIGLPGYDALGDPHLHEYFTRRFSNIPRTIGVSFKSKATLFWIHRSH